MKLNHKQKVKLAKRLRTREEIKRKVSIWLTKAWEKRKMAIQKKIEKRITAIKKRKELKEK